MEFHCSTPQLHSDSTRVCVRSHSSIFVLNIQTISNCINKRGFVQLSTFPIFFHYRLLDNIPNTNMAHCFPHDYNGAQAGYPNDLNQSRGQRVQLYSINNHSK
jgi:hypothetical protein